jgi:Na+-translocating ferredoxin:NAD+ oxidoreductase RnfG subunit
MGMTAVLLVSVALPAQAVVFASRQEAIQAVLPEADRFETRTISLTDDQIQQITTLATTQIDSKLLSVAIGYKGDTIVGYAFFDTRPVRTLPGTFLVSVSPTGTVQKVMVVAFHEPEDYLPTQRWLQQFDGKTLAPELQVYKGIHAISGATLSSQSVTNAVRKASAAFRIVFQGSH